MAGGGARFRGNDSVLGKERGKAALHGRQLRLDDLPDDLEIHGEVAVDHAVPGSGDLLPRDLGVARTGKSS